MWRLGWLLVFVLGCESQLTITRLTPTTESSRKPHSLPSTPLAVLNGRVVWTGAVPQVPDFRFATFAPPASVAWQVRCNPQRIRPSTSGNGLAGAVVSVTGLLDTSRPVRLSPPRLRITPDQFILEPGGICGIMRCGDILEVDNTGPAETLQGRGAAFFSRTMPANTRLRVALTQSGLVELSSNAGHFWQRAWLWVVDHPYHSLTDADGRFTIPDLPEGEYEVTCWLPSWKIARIERDPESGVISRQFYAPAARLVQRVVVSANFPVHVEFTLHESDFPDPR